MSSVSLFRGWVVAASVCVVSLALVGVTENGFAAAPAGLAVKQKAAIGSAKAVDAKASLASVPQTVFSLDLVKKPEAYLNKTVVLDGTFNSFGTLGLDYKKALRDGNKYLSVIILRPDVDHHTIPLSELKLFVARKNSEPLMDLETGDEVRIKGTVFSAALGDPWVDIESLTLLRKAKPKTLATSKDKNAH